MQTLRKTTSNIDYHSSELFSSGRDQPLANSIELANKLSLTMSKQLQINRKKQQHQ